MQTTKMYSGGEERNFRYVIGDKEYNTPQVQEVSLK